MAISKVRTVDAVRIVKIEGGKATPISLRPKPKIVVKKEGKNE